MDEAFWEARWSLNQIAFHEDKPNSLMLDYFDRLAVRPGDALFVPLCGKAVDLDWLMSEGFKVVGAELNKSATEEVFERNRLTPKIFELDDHLHYRADNIEIFVGDFFALTADMIGAVEAIYDRAALVALPPDMRGRYASHLADLTGNARQLLISYDYDQNQTKGPPFSVPNDEIEGHYQDIYRLELLISADISGSLTKRCLGKENALLLEPHDA